MHTLITECENDREYLSLEQRSQGMQSFANMWFVFVSIFSLKCYCGPKVSADK